MRGGARLVRVDVDGIEGKEKMRSVNAMPVNGLVELVMVA